MCTKPIIAKLTIRTDLPNAFGDFTGELFKLEDTEVIYIRVKPLTGQTVNLDYFLFHK